MLTVAYTQGAYFVQNADDVLVRLPTRILIHKLAEFDVLLYISDGQAAEYFRRSVRSGIRPFVVQQIVNEAG